MRLAWGRARAARWGLGAAAALVAAAACRRAAPRPFQDVRDPDVVLVTIDTLRADALGYSGNGAARTPNLDRIASEGVVFTEAHAHNVMTLPSHANILTGLYPYQNGVRDNDGFRLSPAIPTAATLLHARGYSTGAFIGAYPLDSRYGLARGFDVYDQRYPQGAHAYDFEVAERPATEVVEAARKWFSRASGKPRFLWVHVYDCHAPYRPPPPFDKEFASDPYLGEVAAVDAALGPLFADLRRDGRPVLLVVTGDHGEALGDHGELTHGLFAYESTLHVPLLLWSPRELPPRTDSALARHVDILPTILEAADAPVPKGLPGVSLLDGSRAPEDTSYFEALSASLNRGWAPLRGEIGHGYKYIELPVPELYDLRKDPMESHNLFAQKSQIARSLARALPPAGVRPERGNSSAEERAKLRSLGYLSGSAPAKAKYGPEDDPKTLIGLDNEMHQAIDLYQRGELPAAVALARKIVQERPEMPTGYEFLSFLLGQSGEDAEAIRTLEEAGRRHLLDESLSVRLALLYAEAGRSAEALRALAPYSQSDDPDTLNAVGIARASGGDRAGAIAAFRQALASDPRDAEAYQNIAIALLEGGKIDAALKACDEALAVNDRLPRAWNARGVALERAGRHAEALDAWKKAVALDPEQFDALFNIALVAGEQGDRATARQALLQFVKTAPVAHYGADIARARRMLASLGGP
jgi:arylsulfatase A-like enzyme/tetratricopeptide (TPR) repeat protein